MENQLQVVKEEKNLMASEKMNNYYSIVPTSKEDKIKVYNAINSPDVRIGDCINEQIEIKDVLIEVVELTDDQTGEVINAPRTVILDGQGKSYEAVSVGIFSSLKKIVTLFGEPSTWQEPLKVKVIQKTIKKNKMLTLEILND